MAANNRVRIGGGEWRSRLLSFPDAPGLRPTPDRVRQAVFNWLGQELYGLSCLDLFSGTGAMGFEALSRGAKQVIMVEKSTAAYRSLLANQHQLKAEAAQIINMDALQYLAGNTLTFDIIFLDPPYNLGWLSKLLPVMQHHLNPEGVLYVEAEFAVNSSDQWQVSKHGKAGNVFYHLLTKSKLDET